MGLPLGWFKLTQRKKCREAIWLRENTPGNRMWRVECSVPTAHYTGNAADGTALIQGNIWFLSHIDSLERIVRRAWRQRNKRQWSWVSAWLSRELANHMEDSCEVTFS